MRAFTIELAGCCVSVHAMFESTKAFCREYLSELPPDFSVEICPEDIELERKMSARTDAAEGRAASAYADAYLETVAVQRKISEALFDYDTLLFHGSAVAMDGRAYLFTARSGTGKSTHTRLWREVFGGRAVMVNDDKPFLRITNQAVLACGSPWNGKHRLSANLQVPLAAICILERGAENRIEEIRPQDALLMLLQQSNRPQDAGKMPKYLELIDSLSQRLRFYRLQCNMDPQAAVVAYDAMAGK